MHNIHAKLFLTKNILLNCSFLHFTPKLPTIHKLYNLNWIWQSEKNPFPNLESFSRFANHFCISRMHAYIRFAPNMDVSVHLKNGGHRRRARQSVWQFRGILKFITLFPLFTLPILLCKLQTFVLHQIQTSQTPSFWHILCRRVKGVGYVPFSILFHQQQIISFRFSYIFITIRTLS